MAHLTALEQQREDQALGAAWRRCEAALAEGEQVGVFWERGLATAFASGEEPHKFRLPTPTAALEALADALEARRASE